MFTQRGHSFNGRDLIGSTMQQQDELANQLSLLSIFREHQGIHLDEDLADAFQNSFSMESPKATPKKRTCSPRSIRKCHSLYHLKSLERAASDASIRRKAHESFVTLGKSRSREWQEVALRMVYRNITPCPDDTWFSCLRAITNRDYDSLKNWFEARWLAESRNLPSGYLCDSICDDRIIYLRPGAFKSVSNWSDMLFEELVLTRGNLRRDLRDTEWLQ